MPVNSFENYYMSFTPDKAALKTPYVKSLAQLLEQEIISGKLAPHTKLPPQRELADYLDISLQTVTQAYKYCERKGLIYGITGSGTFVHPGAMINLSTGSTNFVKNIVNMAGINLFPEFNSLIADKVKNFFWNIDFERMLYNSTYSRHETALQRSEKWLSFFNISQDDRDVLIVFNRQNGLALIMSSLFKEGDIIVTDEYIYPFFKQLAMNTGVQLVSAKADKYGITPDYLKDICNRYSPQGIYLTPTCQNPLGYSMTAKRREEIADIIKEYNIVLIEDDTSRLSVMDDILPVSCYASENSIYVSDVSTLYSDNLNLALLSVPDKYYDKLFLGALGMNLSIAPALQCELVNALADEVFVKYISEEKLKGCIRRNEIFDSYFGNMHTERNSSSPFRWIQLPEKLAYLTGAEFEKLRCEAGVFVYHSDRFAVGSAITSELKYIRVAISSPKTDEEYETGLKRLYSLIQDS